MKTLNSELLDEVSWKILEELQCDARISYSELGRRVGLSSPAVAERIRRLEDDGVIEGYHAKVNLVQVGLEMLVIIRLSTYDSQTFDRLNACIHTFPEILECHKVTGEDCYIMKAAVRSIPHLEKLITDLKRYARQITTSMVLSSPVTHKVIVNGGQEI